MKKMLGSSVVLGLGCLVVLALAGLFGLSVTGKYAAHSPVVLVAQEAGAPGGADDFDFVDCFVTGGTISSDGTTCTGGAEGPGVNNGDNEPVLPSGFNPADTGG